jgi:hypothetical protein
MGYHWRLRIASASPLFPRTPWFSIQGNGRNEEDFRTAPAVSDAGIATGAPASLRLDTTRPNPTTKGSVLTYSVPRSQRVRLEIFDASGRRVAVLVDQVEEAGGHAVAWNARQDSGAPLPSGVYLARLTAGNEARTSKIVVTRE